MTTTLDTRGLELAWTVRPGVRLSDEAADDLRAAAADAAVPGTLTLAAFLDLAEALHGSAVAEAGLSDDEAAAVRLTLVVRFPDDLEASERDLDSFLNDAFTCFSAPVSKRGVGTLIEQEIAA
ncbi:MAG: hypothetical protein AAFQ53_14825 [Bacteroidota bacterium]